MLESRPAARILVVEDEASLARGIAFNLKAEGYVADCISDGREACEMLTLPGPRSRAGHDLVLLDVMLPRMDGFALTSRIRSDGRYTELPVVLVTGLESQGDRERGVEVGASAYVVKGSFDQSNLLETIRRLI